MSDWNNSLICRKSDYHIFLSDSHKTLKWIYM